MITAKQLNTAELMYILDKMDYYNMSSGHVSVTRDGKIDFVDEEEDNPYALYVTRDELRKLLNQKLSEST